MIVDGFDVCVSRKSWLAYCRKHFLDPEREQEPSDYPCILDRRIAHDESEYVVAITIHLLGQMHGAIVTAARRRRS
jgi:hypothetical protein